MVFCGFGEPLLRPEVVAEVARRLSERGALIRVNTNGTAHLALGVSAADLLQGLRGTVDELSVSLNAADAVEYGKLCRPRDGDAAFPAVLDFIRATVALGFEVTCSAVALPGLDLAPIEDLATELGARFRTRAYRPD